MKFEGSPCMLTHAVTPFFEVWLCISLNPRPYVFVTSFYHMMGSTTLRDVHSPEIDDVIDELAHCSVLKETPKDHSDGSCVKLPKC